HLWGAAACLALVAMWWRRGPSSPWARTVAMATVAGLATYVRPQLGPVWLLVAHDAWDGPERWRRLAVGAAVFVPWPLAHLRTQLWLYGDGLGDYAGEVTHHTGYFLLSTHHGVLTWCPVLGLAAAALVLAAKHQERGAWLLLLLVAMQVWLDGGMRTIEPRSVLGTRTWAGGVSFGPRKLVDVLPLLLPAACSLVSEARRRGHGRAVLGVAVALCAPTVLLHASAWLDPDATTGGIMDGSRYLAALRRPWSLSAWTSAWGQRALPGLVPLVVTLVVTLPLLLAGWLVAALVRTRATDAPAPRWIAAIAAISLLGVHGWLAVAMTRSDAAREADPQRMLRAAARLTAPHLAAVAAIPDHHEQLRRRLGPGAAPPAASAPAPRGP
ncbi:MAG: hypothetical protein AB1Z98_09970, partial [Nannocystaceae bacterium]